MMVDGRGSSNRGLSFEAAIKNRLVSGKVYKNNAEDWGL